MDLSLISSYISSTLFTCRHMLYVDASQGLEFSRAIAKRKSPGGWAEWSAVHWETLFPQQLGTAVKALSLSWRSEAVAGETGQEQISPFSYCKISVVLMVQVMGTGTRRWSQTFSVDLSGAGCAWQTWLPSVMKCLYVDEDKTMGVVHLISLNLLSHLQQTSHLVAEYLQSTRCHESCLDIYG